ncbi:universal stress protein [Ilumatobacter coccineus]|uniref:UspA domain-containing protein n=1 Tax=Ilumatobacter coccineus (strain NBRC 103263 / KCTC 29153 / YM16-304) TaxID=1313172 RepID=A0A6C7EAV9_ILUCY|nr:universal stress protein [Ilumatobacter coccineus]BAN03520.1 hypothetical protein YM304_32060 [Ilumatobacter coccineus YM16-304]
MEREESTDAVNDTREPDDRRWVVGIDGSDSSTHAARWAAAHAPNRASELQLTAAWSIPPAASMAPMGAAVTGASFDAFEVSAHAAVDQAAELLAPMLDLPVTRRVSLGGPAPVLLDAADDSGFLVVGSRGRGGFARLVLGSTSTQCATHSPVPVAVIPAAASLDPVSSILVAFDGSDNSIAALTWAADFAAPGSTIDCVSVWDTSPLAAGADQFFFPDACDLAEERFEHLAQRTIARIGRDDVEVRHTFVSGTPRTTLAEHAATHDLLVMGARGHGALQAAVLGSVSTWLLHHVERPMVVAPHPG